MLHKLACPQGGHTLIEIGPAPKGPARISVRCSCSHRATVVAKDGRWIVLVTKSDAAHNEQETWKASDSSESLSKLLPLYEEAVNALCDSYYAEVDRLKVAIATAQARERDERARAAALAAAAAPDHKNITVDDAILRVALRLLEAHVKKGLISSEEADILRRRTATEKGRAALILRMGV